MVILVTYDLHKPLKNYDKLHAAIKNSSAQWWHYLDSVWLIETVHSANTVGAYLRQFIDKDDRLMAISVRKDYDGWMVRDAWNWLNSKVF